MKKMAVVWIVLIVCLAASAASAVPWQVHRITDYQVDMFPSADTDYPGRFLASVQGHIRSIGPDGSWNDTGVNGLNPVRFNTGLAYYSLPNGLPVVANQYPVTSWTGDPYAGPAVSQNGQYVAFEGHGRLLIADRNGHIVNYQQVWDPYYWTIGMMAWGPDGMIYTIAQDRYDAFLNGYHLFRINPATFTATDVGNTMRGLSEVAASGDTFLFATYNHSRIFRYQWSPSGFTSSDEVWTPGVYYWNLGGAANGRFALLADGYYGGIYEYTQVPEPCSLLVLGSGLAGLISFAVRQRR